MPASTPIAAALLACLLGPAAGLTLALAAWAAGWGGRSACGLALLGASGGMHAGGAPAIAAEPDGAAEPHAGGQVAGRWEALPGDRARLHTAGGVLDVACAADLPALPAGTAVTAWVRCGAGSAPRVVALHARGPARGLWWPRAREAAAARIAQLLPRARRGFVTALLLGERHELHPACVVDARRTGTAHLLALSGLHVVLLARLLRAAARGLLQGGTTWELLGLTGFACLAGGRVSLWRATLGRLLGRGSELSGGGPGALHRLLVVALLLAVWQPAYFALLGTQLSFLAVAGLLGVSRLLPGGAWQLLAPLGAFLCTAPLSVEVFGYVQPMGLLLTPLLVPLFAALLGLGALALLSGGLGSLVDAAWGALLGALSEFVELLLELCAAWCPRAWTPPALPLPGVLASLCVLAALLVLGAARPEREAWLARES